MPIQYKIRRGSTSEANSLTLTEGEIYMDLDQNDLRVHNGTTLGGYRIPNTDFVNELISAEISNLVDSSPNTLNTLNELAAALGDDPNFATTIANQIGLKANTSSLAIVATSGSYNDLSNKPNFSAINSDIRPSFDAIHNLGSTSNRWNNAYIRYANVNTIYLPSNGRIAIDGAIGGVPGVITTLRNNGGALTWDSLSYNDLIDKPNLATVATSGLYNDLIDKPSLATVATSGSYNDLLYKPTIPVFTSQLLNDSGFVGSSGGIVSGLLTTQKTDEVINTKTNATGVVTHDFTSGSIWYHSNISANFTPNFTNVPTTDNRSIVNTLVLSQGATPYIPTALQIDGVAQTIKWLGSTVPTAEAQTVNIVSFVMIRTNNTWTVLGSLSLYG